MKRLIIIICLTMALGCSLSSQQQRVMIETGLYIGMTIAQAIAQHGEPVMRYKARGTTTEEYLVYDDRVLVFVNGELERVDK